MSVAAQSDIDMSFDRMLEEEGPKLPQPEIRVYGRSIDGKRIRDHLRNDNSNPSPELVRQLSSSLERM